MEIFNMNWKNKVQEFSRVIAKVKRECVWVCEKGLEYSPINEFNICVQEKSAFFQFPTKATKQRPITSTKRVDTVWMSGEECVRVCVCLKDPKDECPCTKSLCYKRNRNKKPNAHRTELKLKTLNPLSRVFDERVSDWLTGWLTEPLNSTSATAAPVVVVVNVVKRSKGIKKWFSECAKWNRLPKTKPSQPHTIVNQRQLQKTIWPETPKILPLAKLQPDRPTNKPQKNSIKIFAGT